MKKKAVDIPVIIIAILTIFAIYSLLKPMLFYDTTVISTKNSFESKGEFWEN